ncbi:MAG: hypothetical protein IJ587_05110 [Synergistaceae bacterium]|nr:hypothetical protein [Synergistaceae bacterium]
MITDCISHEEAIIQHFSEDPELAKIMLQDAVEEGDYDEAKKILRRIDEAASHHNDMNYWDNLLDYAETAARNGYNLDTIIARVSQALFILQSAVATHA